MLLWMYGGVLIQRTAVPEQRKFSCRLRDWHGLRTRSQEAVYYQSKLFQTEQALKLRVPTKSITQSSN
eukprot:960727-Amphidinium_carterae.1